MRDVVAQPRRGNDLSASRRAGPTVLLTRHSMRRAARETQATAGRGPRDVPVTVRGGVENVSIGSIGRECDSELASVGKVQQNADRAAVELHGGERVSTEI